MSNALGDFFVNLGIKTDKNSVEASNKNIDSVSNSLNRLIGTARNAAVVTAAFKGIQAAASDQGMSYSLKMGTDALETWRTAIKLAGSDAGAFISKMGQLDTLFRKNSIDGTYDKNLSTNLARLGLGYTSLIDMDAGARTKSIFDAAQAKYSSATTQKEKDDIALILEEILGKEGRKTFEYLTANNKTIDYLLSRSSGALFMDEDTGKNSQAFNEEFTLLSESIKSLSKLFGDEISGGMTQYLKEINQWLQENKDEIKDSLKTISSTMVMLFNDLAPVLQWFKTPAQTMLGTGNNLITAIDDVANGNIKGALKDITLGSGYDIAVEKWRKQFGGSDLQAYMALNMRRYGQVSKWIDQASLKAGLMTQEEFDAYWGKNGLMQQVNTNRVLQDGIMRPDGTITQVAPDDWVFAARNTADLAAAFIPGAAGNSSGPVQIEITQNFTVNGSNDIPQVLKQQAYAGTMDGLTQMLTKAGVTMQLMPGTR